MQGKRLHRSRSDRVLAGVSGGLAVYLNIDPLFVRLGFLILSLMQGIGIVLYLVMWLLVPNEDSSAPDSRGQVQESIGEMRSTAESLIQRLRGLFQSQQP